MSKDKTVYSDEPLYPTVLPRCPRCGTKLICVNERTHKMACPVSTCRR